MAESSGTGFDELVGIVDRLLGPGGCPWDQAQTHSTLRRYLIEETYEVIDAIDAEDWERLQEELGDLLLQPIMHAQIAKAEGRFESADVVKRISDKLVRRHPHVFGDVKAETSAEVLSNWDRIKAEEKGSKPKSRLGGVPRSMPGLSRALEVSVRAARAGFEWSDLEAVFEKLDEERRELHEAIDSNDRTEIEHEIGDLLFTVVNVARWLKVDPEECLRHMVDRFTSRFESMEAASQKRLEELSPEEWDELWNRSKAQP